MEMFMLLLVSAAAQLVSPAALPAKNQSLNHVIDAVEKYNTSLFQEYFVEDVTALADAGCNDTFYCKVREILNHHHNPQNPKDNGDKKVLRTLEQYIKSTQVNCDDALKNVKKSDQSKPLVNLLENLAKCIRVTNFNSPKNNN